MDALRATYGSDSDQSDESPPVTTGINVGGGCSRRNPTPMEPISVLPPPPLELIRPADHLGISTIAQGTRIRSFPHVEGNYALHVFIPVYIPSTTRKHLALAMKKITSLVPNLYVVDIDIALSQICKDDQKFDQILLGREFHVSLGRTVPIKVHQIDSIVTMLRQKFQSQRRYLIEFNEWEVFVNDDKTRSFLSLEVTNRGLSEISQQIRVVDDIYKLHGLPEFYKNPRPHISLVWGLGDISFVLKETAEEANRFHRNTHSWRKPLFSCNLSGVECKIGKKSYTICKCVD